MSRHVIIYSIFCGVVSNNRHFTIIVIIYMNNKFLPPVDRYHRLNIKTYIGGLIEKKKKEVFPRQKLF